MSLPQSCFRRKRSSLYIVVDQPCTQETGEGGDEPWSPTATTMLHCLLEGDE